MADPLLDLLRTDLSWLDPLLANVGAPQSSVSFAGVAQRLGVSSDAEMDQICVRDGRRLVFLLIRDTMYKIKVCSPSDERQHMREVLVGELLRQKRISCVATSFFNWTAPNPADGSVEMLCTAFEYFPGLPINHCWAQLSDSQIVKGLIAILEVYAAADPRSKAYNPGKYFVFGHGDLHEEQILYNHEGEGAWKLIDLGLSFVEYSDGVQVRKILTSKTPTTPVSEVGSLCSLFVKHISKEKRAPFRKIVRDYVAESSYMSCKLLRSKLQEAALAL